MILGEEILCRPMVGADGLYNDVLPIRNKQEGAKSADTSIALSQFLILGEEILCRPMVGADGLYKDVLPIRNKREGAKSTA